MSKDGRSARAQNIYDEAHKNLVDSAIELFNNPDIPNEKINLTLIAEKAGTSVATAYNHFPENLIDVFGSIFNIAFEKWRKIVYIKHPYAYNSYGYEEDISKITHNDILYEYEKFK